MQFLSPGPPSPTAVNGSGSTQQKSYFGGSVFTSPPEEVGDLQTENKGRRTWWRGEKGFSISGKVSRNEKANKEKQRSGKEKSGEAPIEEKKESSKGESQDENVGVEGKVKVETKIDASKGDVQEGAVKRPGSGKAQKDDTRAEVAAEVKLVGEGSHLVWEGNKGEVKTVDQQPKPEIAERCGDNTAKSLRDKRSSRSLNSSKSTNQSQDSAKPGKKGWSLKISKRFTPEQIPLPIKRFTEDVAGSRFEATKEPEGERCAGDYPPIYVDGFVSLILSSHFYVS